MCVVMVIPSNMIRWISYYYRYTIVLAQSPQSQLLERHIKLSLKEEKLFKKKFSKIKWDIGILFA